MASTKWCRFQSGANVTYGLIEGDQATAVTGSPFDSYTRASTSTFVSRVKMLVPVIPPTFYAAGVNYREHVTEMAQRRGVKPEFPPQADVGYRANNALIPTDEPIVIPWHLGTTIRMRQHRLAPRYCTFSGQQPPTAINLASDVEGLRRELDTSDGAGVPRQGQPIPGHRSLRVPA